MNRVRPTYEELEARLYEAEKIIEALRGDEVDAIVGKSQIAYVRLREAEEARRKAEEEIRRLNDELEERVRMRTAQLRTLAGELTQAEQRERRRLAQVLHDHLQQLLVGAKFKILPLKLRYRDPALIEAVGEVEDLLDQSIDASRSLSAELSPPVLYDAGLVAALEWLCRQMQRKHGLKVSLKAEESAEPESENLKIMLFHSVNELLFNVVKHSGQRAASLEASRTDDGRLRIIVADEGRGFDRRNGAEGNFAAKGFGLFSIEQRLELLGGRLQVSSSSGHGVRAVIEVPVAQKEEEVLAAIPEVLAAPVPERSGGRKIRVLLADDHQILRQGLSGLLTEQGDMDVVGEASDGKMAVELARKFRPDVVVMDLSMPVLNGIEATRLITAELKNVQVIGLSMHDQESMARAMADAGAAAYLTKDGSYDALIRAIRTCSSRHQADSGSGGSV